MLIVIGGMIGLGKTTIAEYIADNLNANIYYESVDDNPILPLYYTESPEEIQKNRYPFLLQLYFLNSRFKTIKDASLHATKGISVIDRSIYEDWYFAKTNYNLGRMTDLEFSIYEKILNNMMEELDTVPKKAPDLMVYLDGSLETVLERIKRRGREYELAPDLVDYYQVLHEGYGLWLQEHYRASEVLVIDTNNLNVVDNLDDRNYVLDLINKKISEIKTKK